MKDDKILVMDSINPVMDLLDEVVRKGLERNIDKKWMFSYILTELETIFKEDGDVSVCELWSDVRLP